MRATPAAWLHNSTVVRSYPNWPKESRVRNPDKVFDEFKQHVVGNLLWLHDQVPAEIRSQSKRWYDGARRITDAWSERYGVPDHSIAGALAALSPQKDWYQNVSLAERVLDIMAFKSGEPWTDAMAETARRIYRKPDHKPLVDAVRGKSLTDIKDERAAIQATWVRVYDETYHDRAYRVVSAEGEFIGEPSGKVAWGSNTEIGKAIAVIRDPSYENVSRSMGERHKVRNFFNNILAPNSPHGDVTIDTHAVAAGLLRPLSGASAEVHHNFGSSPEKKKQPKGWIASKKSGVSGAEGTYGVYADAYREAAAQRGILAREMQSITWEAVRGLFPAKWKRAKNVAAADAIWNEFREGTISVEDARRKINDLAGGIADPSWYGPDSGGDAGVSDASYARDLPGTGVPGQSAIRVDGGARGGVAGAVPDQGLNESSVRFQRPALSRSPAGRAAAAQQTQTAHIPDRSLWEELAAANRSALDRMTGGGGALRDRLDRRRSQQWRRDRHEDWPALRRPQRPVPLQFSRRHLSSCDRDTE
ncbi:DUF7178 family protein [Jannaschia seohaensis]|uniref:Uncharacterized protein n=1 Tax=Jannaschia seohaensis TaxID=475081 RepID=A0A2Y9B487_9RHOB|nr:hypothetical protein BCF38_11336 [Jannaschia seohaensis]SSA50318.1 hypothetical protein SAMN05421539_11336 [Jannaschia seohaensis]